MLAPVANAVCKTASEIERIFFDFIGFTSCPHLGIYPRILDRNSDVIARIAKAPKPNRIEPSPRSPSGRTQQPYAVYHMGDAGRGAGPSEETAEPRQGGTVPQRGSEGDRDQAGYVTDALVSSPTATVPSPTSVPTAHSSRTLPPPFPGSFLPYVSASTMRLVGL